MNAAVLLSVLGRPGVRAAQADGEHAPRMETKLGLYFCRTEGRGDVTNACMLSGLIPVQRDRFHCRARVRPQAKTI